MQPTHFFTTVTIIATLCGAAGTVQAQASSPSRNNASKTTYPASDGGAASGSVTREQVIAELYAARNRGEIPEICADYDVAHTRLRETAR
jgi:hypothetical protein